MNISCLLQFESMAYRGSQTQSLALNQFVASALRVFIVDFYQRMAPSFMLIISCRRRSPWNFYRQIMQLLYESVDNMILQLIYHDHNNQSRRIPGPRLHNLLLVDSLQALLNEYINMFINCLLEVLGILVFFAICTIAFWLTLGYHLVQLLISLIHADRSVHMAIGIVLALLILACTVTLSTQPGGVSPIFSCSKCKQPSKSTSVNQIKLSIFAKIKAMLPVLGKEQQQKQSNKDKSRGARSYSDCQGRKIFNNLRRSALLMEMKQPPTWIIWLSDFVNRFLCRS
ncbi:GH17622 [Drosophila grimshawi]|uniref:GH17622 n=1 Tax=Drosophila grimshawi TaxID=7222 RepID=B4JX74_DROGR|nr:GH17622 [Drosophila grimshawi]